MSAKKRCIKCGKCCRGCIGPFVFPSDVKRISEALVVSPQYFLTTYCSSYMLHYKNHQAEIYYLKNTENVCVFLKDNLCSIYEVRPYQCVYAPYQFFADAPEIWEHLPCIDKNLLQKCDSEKNEIRMFSELLGNGYNNL